MLWLVLFAGLAAQAAAALIGGQGARIAQLVALVLFVVGAVAVTLGAT